MNILSIDIGTTSTRGILYDGNGQTLDALHFQTPLLFLDGFIEQSPQLYRRILLRLCQSFAARYTVDAISLTAYRSAPTLVDADGQALCNFIMWQDTRNEELCRSLSSCNEQIYQRTGASVNTVFTGGKLAWLRQNRPELYQRCRRAMIVPDYLIYLMTGQAVTDRTYGSRTALMNIHTLAWDQELCRLFRIDEEKLCRLIDPGTIAGRTTEAFGKLTGIAAGTPVVSAGGDQQCSLLGLGVLDASSLAVNSGTGSFVLSLLDKPYLGNYNMICNVSAVPGKYMLESNILACAAAVNWMIRELFPEYWNGGEPDFEAMNQLAQAAPPLAGGLVCIPHFQGCGSRDWNPNAKALFYGLSLGSRRQDFIRALFEGIAAETAKSVSAMPLSCQAADAVYIAGGLAKSDVYSQILSDMMGKTLVRYSDSQATAIGAFASAAVCLGLFPGYGEAVRAVRRHSSITRYFPDMGRRADYASYMRESEKIYRRMKNEEEDHCAARNIPAVPL